MCWAGGCKSGAITRIQLSPRGHGSGLARGKKFGTASAQTVLGDACNDRNGIGGTVRWLAAVTDPGIDLLLFDNAMLRRGCCFLDDEIAVVRRPWSRQCCYTLDKGTTF